MKVKFLLLCIVVLSSCGTARNNSDLRNNERAIKIARVFIEKDSPEFYQKYCTSQNPVVETRYIESGKYKGLGIQIVTYNYSQNAVQENSTFIDYAVKVYINSKTGQVVTKLLGPEGIGKIYDRELFQQFSKNILQLVK